MVRWGVLGAGSVARRRVMPAMQAHPGCALQALMVRDLERAGQLATEFGVAHHHDRVEDLLTDPELDAVYVSSPVYLHCEHVLAAAARGRHVLCEKPMAMAPEECERMIAACDAGVEATPADFPDYYSGLLDHFCGCVGEGGPPLASGEDGLRNTEAIEGAYRTAREGCIVELPA